MRYTNPLRLVVICFNWLITFVPGYLPESDEKTVFIRFSVMFLSVTRCFAGAEKIQNQGGTHRCAAV